MKFAWKTATAILMIAGFSHGIASPAVAQDSRLSVHGYLTQAYAVADSLPIYGITTDGTTDYRTAVLLFRYALTPNDNVVLQLRSRQAGTDLIAQAEDDVMLQWAFYQRRLGNASVRVGKVPMPMGFFNETRYVGTVVPFYRAPVTIYPEGMETLDGVSANYRLGLGDWEVEAGANVGAFSIAHVSVNMETGVPTLTEMRSDRYVSGSVTVNTPIRGVRGGVVRQMFEMPGDMPWDGVTNLFSLEAVFERLFARGEYIFIVGDGEAFDMEIKSYYVQGGAQLLPRFWLNGQYERSDTWFDLGAFGGELEQTAVKDLAVGLSYAVSPNLVLKVEGHNVKGFVFDDTTFMSPERTGRYLITSLSVSF